MNKLLFIIIPAILLTGCANKESALIMGNYSGEGHDYIYITRMDLNLPGLIDSAKINRSGKFKIRVEPEQSNFFNLSFNDNDFITVIAFPGDRLELIFPEKSLQNNYTVSGSPESEKIRMLDDRLRTTLRSLDSLKSDYLKYTDEGSIETMGPELEEAYLQKIKDQRNSNIAFILDNMGSLSSIKALYQKIDETTYVLYEPRDLQYLKIVSDSLKVYYPNSMHVKSLAENLEKELNQMYSSQLSDLVSNIEATGLDADLEDINGNRVKISSLMKKYHVLVSFWSAQSDECVSENLYLKELYNKYHKKGFEIYQINIDTDEDSWRSSVKFDELPWISVREDDPAYPKTALLFNVTNVPANYFLDLEGNIVAKNLFGRNLQIKLSQLFD